jgi:hypothetical protein
MPTLGNQQLQKEHLQKLFGKNVVVDESLRSGWTVRFENLSTTEVRELAARLNQSLTPK